MTEPAAHDRPKNRRLSAEARRETILTAALEVFAEYGQEGGRLRQIAARAGITEPYLFRHFASKAELYDAAVKQPLVKLVERFERRITTIPQEGSLTSLGLITRINRLILEFMLDAVPYIGVSMFSDASGSHEFYTKIVYPRVHGAVIDLLRHIKGWPSPTVSLELVANSMWGINYGIALDSLLTGFEIDIAKTTERVTRLYTLGIPSFQPIESGAGG